MTRRPDQLDPKVNLNLATQSKGRDRSPTFIAFISVPGDPANAGVAIAQDGSPLVVLVSSGTNVYAYNANTGAAVCLFTTTAPVNSIASIGHRPPVPGQLPDESSSR